MKVLVECEFSGVVREAFLRRGHDAYSCDLLPSLYHKAGKGRHIQGDVRPLLSRHWDLIIAHPPCTYLTNSGVQFLKRPGRREKMREGAAFFRLFLDCGADRICVENPTPHGEAREIIGRPTQTVQPWQFGHPWSKRTGLWLKNLPPLVPTNVLENFDTVRSAAEEGPNPWRPYKRSITFFGLAEAMAEQWGVLGKESG